MNAQRIAVLVLCVAQAHWLSTAVHRWHSPALLYAAQALGVAVSDTLTNKPLRHDLWHAPLYFFSIAMPMFATQYAPLLAPLPVATLFRTGSLPINLILRADWRATRWIGSVLVSLALAYTIYKPDRANADITTRFVITLLLIGGNIAGALLGVRQETDGESSRWAFVGCSVAFALLADDYRSVRHTDLLISFVLSYATSTVMFNYFAAEKRQSFSLTLLLTIRRFISASIPIFAHDTSQAWLVWPLIGVATGTIISMQ